LAQGTVKRLSIAVLVDQGSKWEGQGAQVHRVVTPPDPEKLKAIQALVSTLVGLDTQRGDQLTVEALPFDNTLSAEPLGAGHPDTKKPDEVLSFETLKKKPALLWGSVGGAVLVIALVVFAVTRMGKRRVPFETREVLPAPPGSVGALAASGVGAGALSAGDGHQLPALMPSRTEVLLNQLQDSGRNNPELWAGILRGWLTEEEAN
jgi:flagellar biosynthesis/type III secretory pathway M-ring protein FliF/YscJ